MTIVAHWAGWIVSAGINKEATVTDKDDSVPTLNYTVHFQTPYCYLPKEHFFKVFQR